MFQKIIMATTCKIKSYKPIICPSLLMSITFFFFGPLEMFLTQPGEFWFTDKQLIPLILITTIISSLLLIIISIPIKKYIKIYAAFLFSTALAMYIQGNFMFISYGTLDGAGVDWESYRIWGYINCLIWVIIITSVLFLSIKKTILTTSIINYISICVISIQLLTVSSVYLISDKTLLSKENSLILSEEGMFNLSKNDNTIIFVLDCFDITYMDHYLDLYPEIQEILFEDFTYFQNTVGGATRTRIALPFILTGNPYNENNLYSDYLDQSYEKTELYRTLKENNYDTRLFTSPQYVSDSQEMYINNFVSDDLKIGSKTLLLQDLYKLTAFRYFPHILKKEFEIYSGDFTRSIDLSSENDISYQINDSIFYSKMSDSIQLMDGESNVFRLYHLFGAHAPYTLSENAEKVSKSNLITQITGNMLILNDYFNQMKELGIYDNANIIIMSDHGVGVNYEANPILLVKRSNEHHPFVVSQNPVSYMNLHPTLLEMIEKEEYSNTFYSDLSHQKNRFFYVQSGDKIIEYTTNENNDKLGLIPTGKEILFYSESLNFMPGTEYFFGGTGEAMQFSESGISGSETEFAWTDGHEAVIKLDLSNFPSLDDTEILRFNIKLASIYQGNQRVGISVNGKFLGNLHLTSETEFNFDIESQYVVGDEIELSFMLPDAVSPSYVASASDHRILALALKSISADVESASNIAVLDNMESLDNNLNKPTESMYSLGTVITSEHFSQQVVYGIDKDWTSGINAQIRFMIGEQTEDMELQMSVTSTYNGEQRIICSSQGITIFEDVLSSSAILKIPISSEFIEENQILLDFQFIDAVSPQSLGKSDDSRLLALSIENFLLDKIVNLYPYLNKSITTALIQDIDWPKEITLSDWHGFEANATWTSSDSSVQFQTELETDFTITFPYHKFQSDKETIVYFNDVEVEVLSESAGTASVLLPKDLLLADDMQTIRFVTPEATSPKELGRSDDGRILGIMVESITIAPHNENP